MSFFFEDMSYSTASQGNAPNQERRLDISSTSQPAIPGDDPRQNTPPEITPTCQPALETMPVSTATPGGAARHHATVAGTSPPPQAVTSAGEHAITEGGSDQETTSNIARSLEIIEEGGPSSRAASGDVRDEGARAPPTADAIVEETKKLWRDAIRRRDCKELTRILVDSDRGLSLDIIQGEIREEGRTALHVASMQGCLRVIAELHLISELKMPGVWNLYMDVKDKRSGFTAFEMSKYLRDGLIIDAFRKISMGIGQPKYELEGADMRVATIVLNNIVAAVNWPENLENAFKRDVDFNFAGANEAIVFRFHHACKLHCQGGEDYIRHVWDLLSHSKSLREALCAMQDRQGRVPLENYVMDGFWCWELIPQGLLEHTPAKIAIRISRRHIIKEYIQCDGDVGKLSLRNIYSFLETEAFSSKRKSYFPLQFVKTPLAWKVLLDLLILLRCTREAVHKIKKIADRKGWTISCTNDKEWRKPCLNTIPSISFAASIGDQAILQLLLQKKFDPFTYDAHSRTPLHYAVDTAFQPGLACLQYCSVGICIEDYCDLKRIWTREVLGKDIHYVGKQACINILLRAGVDIWREDEGGEIADPKLPLLEFDNLGISISKSECGGLPKVNFDQLVEHQNWWNEKVVKDTMESKNNFNQASNALSVVGTLVAATSYVGPLQPPLNYSYDGHVDTTQVLIRSFMVSNTLAFYLAIAAVMFAVVPSLPMPEEGVVEELRRARHTVALSLCLLLVSILCVITSFASASIIVIGPSEHPFHPSSLLFSPTIIGLFFCSIAIFGFFIRVMRLVFYRNVFIRKIYKVSFTDTSRFVFYMLFVLFLSIVFSPFFIPITVLLFIFRRYCNFTILQKWL